MKLLLTVLVIIAALLVLNASSRWRKRHAEYLYPPPGEGTDADVERFITLGRKLTATKLYREIHGVDLKEARKAVEELSKRPDLRRRR